MKLPEVDILIGPSFSGKSTQAANIARAVGAYTGAPVDVLDTRDYLFERIPRKGWPNTYTLPDGTVIDLLETQRLISGGDFAQPRWTAHIMNELIDKTIAQGRSCVLPGSPRTVEEAWYIHENLVRLQREEAIGKIALVWIRFVLVDEQDARGGKQEDFSIGTKRLKAEFADKADDEQAYKLRDERRRRRWYTEEAVPALELLRFSPRLETDFEMFFDDGETPPEVISERICEHFGWPILKEVPK